MDARGVASRLCGIRTLTGEPEGIRRRLPGACVAYPSLPGLQSYLHYLTRPPPLLTRPYPGSCVAYPTLPGLLSCLPDRNRDPELLTRP